MQIIANNQQSVSLVDFGSEIVTERSKNMPIVKSELFAPFRFPNGLTLRNHVVMAPMTTWSASDDETVSDAEISYYRRRARGVGLVVTGCTHVTANGVGFTGEFAAYDDTFIPSLHRLSDAARSGGAPAVLLVRLSKSDNAAAYAASVQQRVQALSRTHILLAEKGWQEVELAEIIRAQTQVAPSDDAVSNILAKLQLERRRMPTIWTSGLHDGCTPLHRTLSGVALLPRIECILISGRINSAGTFWSCHENGLDLSRRNVIDDLERAQLMKFGESFRDRDIACAQHGLDVVNCLLERGDSRFVVLQACQKISKARLAHLCEL